MSAKDAAENSAEIMAATAALDTAKKLREGGDLESAIVTLSTGVRARLIPVAGSLIQEVSLAVKEPDIPVWMNPDKGREEENPDDPTYRKQMREYENARGKAALSAMILFGVELVDPLPEDRSWVRKLQYLEKMDALDLSGFDLEDALDQEYLFKRYVALSNDDLIELSKMSGVREEDIAKAAEEFKSKDTE